MTTTIGRGPLGTGRVATCAVILLLAGGVFARAAWAQAQPDTVARVRLGALQVTPELRLQNLGVDSNVYNVSRAVSDFTFTVTPDISVRAGNARTKFAVRSATDLVYFAQHGSERSVNELLTGTAQTQMSRLIMDGSAGYVTTRQRPTDEIDARSRRIEYNAQGSIGLAISPRLSALVGGRYAKTAFDADAIFDDTYLAKQLNREARAATAHVKYALTPITSFVVSADLTRTRFAQSPIRDSDSHGAYGGIDFNPKGLISGGAALGYQRFDPLNPSVPRFDGLVGSVGMRFRVQRLTTVGFSLDRHIEYSYSEEQPYFVQEAYGVSLQRQLTPRITVEGNLARSRYVYRRTTTDGASVSSIGDRQMRLVDAGVSAGYRTAPNTLVKFVLQYRGRHSDFANRSYSGVRAMTSVVYGF